jgi:hypothetical protein
MSGRVRMSPEKSRLSQRYRGRELCVQDQDADDEKERAEDCRAKSNIASGDYYGGR